MTSIRRHALRNVVILCGAVALISNAAAETTDQPAGVALADTEWVVASIAGDDALDDPRVSLMFHGDGSLSGSGSCNRLRGGYEVEGSELRFAPVATTMMICPDNVMAQEKRLLDFLQDVTSWSIDDMGALTLKTGDGQTIVARQAADAEQ